MNNDDQIRRAFETIEFRDEPPMASMAADDAQRGRRHLRNRRTAVWSSGVASVAALAAAGALVLPGGGGAGPEVDVAGGPDDSAAAKDAATGDTAVPKDSGATEPETGYDPEWLPFPKTRQLLLDTAAEHLDPDRTHLPDESDNAPNGGNTGGDTSGPAKNWTVGTKLSWSVPKSVAARVNSVVVEVAVTTPGYASSEDYALEGVALDIGCYISEGTCTQQTIPGTGETVWVDETGLEEHMDFAVIYERDDGSIVGVGVFGVNQNSGEAGSDDGIGLEQAFDFVTDPDLHVVPEEAADETERDRAERAKERERIANLDFSNPETIPAPDAEEMSKAEAQETIDTCVSDDRPEWEGFEAVWGVRAEVDPDALSRWIEEASWDVPLAWVVGERDGTYIGCGLQGGLAGSGEELPSAGLFGSAEAKDSPNLTSPVEAKLGPHFGLYDTSSVARVTVQTDGRPEQDAIMGDGYWFLPHGGPNFTEIALRGYDADGELVFDSTK